MVKGQEAEKAKREQLGAGGWEPREAWQRESLFLNVLRPL